MNMDKVADKILVLSPHTDDAELGAGGTVSRLLEEGKEIYYIAFSGCETSAREIGIPIDTLRRECKISTSTLGIIPDNVVILNYEVRTFPEHRQEILDDLIKFKNRIKPQLILTPSSNDIHQDHKVIFEETLRAFKRDCSIWGYEHPWNNLTFTTDIFVKLDQKHVENKLKALKEYKSQSHKSYMNEVNIRSLINTRGSQLDLNYAEAFELLRLIL